MIFPLKSILVISPTPPKMIVYEVYQQVSFTNDSNVKFYSLCSIRI